MKEELDDNSYKIELYNLYKRDPYVYKNGTLKNKLGITDYEKLRQAEADISFVKLFTIDQDVTLKGFSIDYLKALHAHILGDIFDWAGEFRTVPIVKSEKILAGDTVRYAQPDEISTNLNNAIRRLNNVKWQEKTVDQLVPIFTMGISYMWQTHPFRDGNTRTIVAYALRFAKEKGFELDSNLILNHFDYVRGAFVWASQGEYSDYSYINKIVKDAILRQMVKNEENKANGNKSTKVNDEETR